MSERSSQSDKGGRPNGVLVWGDRVRELRDAFSWTQEDLAAQARVSLRTIYSVERSQRVSVGTIRAIAKALEIEAKTLLKRNHSP